MNLVVNNFVCGFPVAEEEDDEIPPSIAGLTLWIDPSQNVTLDGSSRVSQIIDRSSEAIEFTQSDSALRPDINASAQNGHPSLRTDGTARHMVGPERSTIRNWTIFAVMKTASTATWFSKGSSTLSSWEMYLFTGANFYIAGTMYDFLGASQHLQLVENFSFGGYTDFHISCTTKEGAHQRVYNNGAVATHTAGTCAAHINDMDDIWILHGVANTTATPTGTQNTEICELIVYDRRLTVEEQETIDTYLSDKYNIATTPAYSNADRPAIFFVGDSITSGVGASPYPAITLDDGTFGLNRSSRVYDGANHGEASITLQQHLARINTDLIPYLNNGDIVVLFHGGNDLEGGRTATQVIDDMDDYIAAIRATGKTIDIVGMTILNRDTFDVTEGSKDGTDSGYQGTINAHVRITADFDAVWDSQAQVNLQTTTTHPNTYYQAGGVHPTTAGMNVIAAGLAATIDAL